MSFIQPNQTTNGAIRKTIFRNTFFLAASQVLTVPLAVFINAMLAHYMGAEVFGYAYLAATLCGFGFLAVGWGHEAVLPAVVARDHSLSGTVLGSSLAWRAATSVVVYSVLAFSCYLIDDSAGVQCALGLRALRRSQLRCRIQGHDSRAGADRYSRLRAFRTATARAVLVMVVLLLGGKLRAVLFVQAVFARSCCWCFGLRGGW